MLNVYENLFFYFYVANLLKHNRVFVLFNAQFPKKQCRLERGW